MLRRTLLSSLATALSWTLFAGCGGEPAGAVAGAGAAAAAPPREDAPLAPYQVELLELAFQAASAMPTDPHLKNRSRAQETVVAACLQLDQPARALAYLEQIGDWRRGACHADLAFHLAQRGDPAKAAEHLAAASRIADESMRDDASQVWRRDRIRAKVARTHLLLGNRQQAGEFEKGLVDSELGELVSMKAKELAPDDFDKQLAVIDATLANANFDQAKSALLLCAGLFERFHADPARAAQAEQRVKTGYQKLPVGDRLAMLLELAESALRNKAPAKAQELLAYTRTVMESVTWFPADRITMEARLVALQARAGDRDKAKVAADAALALFHTERTKIVDIYRGAALRPLADAYRAIGDEAAAMAVYRRAVEEGVVNPNSRPRAEDLAATCIAMAVTGFEPDAAMLARLREVRAALGHPW